MYIQDKKVIVLGAGPVGMLAALLAASKGFSVTLIEKRTERISNSRAIGITPPSLEILRKIGLHEKLISSGIPVYNAEARSTSRILGKLDFTSITSDFNFVLSVPQDRTEYVLETAVLSSEKITFLRGHEAQAIINSADKVTVNGISENKTCFTFSTDYLIACDGSKSFIRQLLEIRWQGCSFKHTFLMGDFDDNSGWSDKAVFYFTSRGSVESFPLTDNKRRYVLRTPEFTKEYTSDYLQKEIALRCGIDTSNITRHWESAFGVQRFTASEFAKGRVFLCGDAAHVMPPMGGQNMNIGFADAEMAVFCLSLITENDISSVKVKKLYTTTRKKAANTAGFRSEYLMKLVTSGGAIWSMERNISLWLLFRTPIVKLFISVFSMMSIPYRNLSLSAIFILRKLGL
jgi:2-polyprenyl-6-methoxyphenol hydroxylase-like FAD-dependent oxidoreductase